MSALDEAGSGSGRVSTLELFFDLVFVFTVAELTTVLFAAPNWRGTFQVLLMLSVIWWMYGGYAWLTNAVSAGTTSRRLLLLGGMAGFLIVALSVPNAFESSGLAFGLGYLIVVGVHSILFTRATSASAVRAMVTLAPLNLGFAGVVVAGGALGGAAQYALWGGGALFQWLSPRIWGPGRFTISPAHFVERHGVVMIVAIGESVVAVGLGASHLPVDAALVSVATVGLALSAALWWLYFDSSDEDAERALLALEPPQRASAALQAFGYWHVPMLLGVVAIAAAERAALSHPFSALSWSRAAILGGGVTVFLVGDVLFRRELRIDRGLLRTGAAAAALATIPLGTVSSGFVQLLALVALLVATLAGEQIARSRLGP